MNTIKPQELKPNELRIGNIVKGIYITEEYNEETDNYDDKEIEILCRVLGVDSTGAYDWPIVLEALNKDDFKYDITEYDKVVGIALTEEILLRCGFEKHRKYDMFVFRDFIVEFLFDKWNIRICIDKENSIFIKSLLYFHDLQNCIYSFNNEELTLKDHE